MDISFHICEQIPWNIFAELYGYMCSDIFLLLFYFTLHICLYACVWKDHTARNWSHRYCEPPDRVSGVTLWSPRKEVCALKCWTPLARAEHYNDTLRNCHTALQSSCASLILIMHEWSGFSASQPMAADTFPVSATCRHAVMLTVILICIF